MKSGKVQCVYTTVEYKEDHISYSICQKSILNGVSLASTPNMMLFVPSSL